VDACILCNRITMLRDMMKGTQDVPLTDLLSKVVNDKINARNRLGLMT